MLDSGSSGSGLRPGWGTVCFCARRFIPIVPPFTQDRGELIGSGRIFRGSPCDVLCTADVQQPPREGGTAATQGGTAATQGG